MTQKTVMIVGSGAREDTLSCAYEKSPQIDRIIVAPGNDFIGHGREKEVIIDKEASLKDPESFLRLARKYKPDFVDVAQDDALANGTVDLLQENGFPSFGPKKSAAKIEGDKRWSRKFMQRQGIPQPAFECFEDEASAEKHAEGLYRNDPDRLIYVKAAGLCGGKGALKTTGLAQAIKNIRLMKTFPDEAGKVFLIEMGERGEEFSGYVLSDGKNVRNKSAGQEL